MVNCRKKYLKLFFLIFTILFCYVFQTIVYSAFSSTMNINGTAHSRVEADVRITDFRLANSNNAISFYENFGKSQISTEVNLSNSSSSITYYLEITNYGSVDVGIFDITGLPSNVIYFIKDYNLHDKICDDTGKCNNYVVKTYEITLSSNSSYSGVVQLNFEFRTYHKVTYIDIENKGYAMYVIDGGNLDITFKEELKRIQFISNDVEVAFYNIISNGEKIIIGNISNDIIVKKKEVVVKLVNGKINQIGSEVCIKDECFYIINNDGEKVTMLAKYNLYVGNIVNSSQSVSLIQNPTGLQNSTALGSNFSNPPYIATLSFADNNYWSSTVNSYPANVYNENSILFNYIEWYKQYLISSGAGVNKVRLITYDELINLGCNLSNNSCNSAPSWVYTTSYWSGSAYDSVSIYTVIKINHFDFFLPTYNTYFGIRPVVEVDIDEISFSPVAKLVSGNLDTVGSEVCIENECFYIISSTEKNVTMLAKYNLYAGGMTSQSTHFGYGSEATGIQDSTMKGYVAGESVKNGVTRFSQSRYWDSEKLNPEYGSDYPAYVYDDNSLIYDYVEKYKKYLKSLGGKITESRIIRFEELVNIGCSQSDNNCNSAPKWVYSSSYWTGTANDNLYIWFVDTDGIFSYSYYGINPGYSYGIRPVVVIPKSEF